MIIKECITKKLMAWDFFFLNIKKDMRWGEGKQVSQVENKSRMIVLNLDVLVIMWHTKNIYKSLRKGRHSSRELGKIFGWVIQKRGLLNDQ